MDKPGRERAQPEHLKAQAHLFETWQAVENRSPSVPECASKTHFPLEKETLQETEASCMGSLGLMTVRKIFMFPVSLIFLSLKTISKYLIVPIGPKELLRVKK